MLDIIVFGAIGVFLIVKLIKIAQEKNEREKKETARAEVEAAAQARTEKLLESEFFKYVYSCLVQANNKRVDSLIKSNKPMTKKGVFFDLWVTEDCIHFGSSLQPIVDFVEMGYGRLSYEETGTLKEALKMCGYPNVDPDASYVLIPDFEYWQKATGNRLRCE